MSLIPPLYPLRLYTHTVLNRRKEILLDVRVNKICGPTEKKVSWLLEFVRDCPLRRYYFLKKAQNCFIAEFDEALFVLIWPLYVTSGRLLPV